MRETNFMEITRLVFLLPHVIYCIGFVLFHHLYKGQYVIVAELQSSNYCRTLQYCRRTIRLALISKERTILIGVRASCIFDTTTEARHHLKNRGHGRTATWFLEMTLNLNVLQQVIDSAERDVCACQQAWPLGLENL